jgi:hypothetical protein
MGDVNGTLDRAFAFGNPKVSLVQRTGQFIFKYYRGQKPAVEFWDSYSEEIPDGC